MTDKEILIGLIESNEMEFIRYCLEIANGDVSGVITSKEEFTADRLIANGVTIQKHGRWVFDNGVDYCQKCSECKTVKPPHYIRHSYCPHCGAKMHLEE